MPQTALESITDFVTYRGELCLVLTTPCKEKGRAFADPVLSECAMHYLLCFF